MIRLNVSQRRNSEMEDEIKSKLRKKWYAMKQRCSNPNLNSYKYYGKKGIKVCDEWKTNFENFYLWSLSNGYKKGLTLDRIDNSKNYEPNNCRYADVFTQANNTTKNVFYEYKGEFVTLGTLSKKYKINYKLLFSRIHKQHMSIENALTLPQRRTYNNISQRRGAEVPIIRLTKNDEYVDEFVSLIEAEHKTSIKRKAISKCLRKTNPTAGGYKWEYKEKK